MKRWPSGYKERMYFDPVARQMWLDGVKALMTGKKSLYWPDVERGNRL